MQTLLANLRQATKKPTGVGFRSSVGGDEEDRTPDLRIANATLSQLSYVPTEREIVVQTKSGTLRPKRACKQLPQQFWRQAVSGYTRHYRNH